MEKESYMKEPANTTLSFDLDKANYSTFFPLLQQGFLVKVQVGKSIKNVLCEQCQVDDNYLEERIKTIFLDGKPVDDMETAIVKNGSTVALSAAMPGLVGATFRRGGILAGFRNGITYQSEDAATDSQESGMVNIKLFNMVVRELGPKFLNEGIWVKKEDIESLLKNRADTLRAFLRSAKKDGKEIDPEQLEKLIWSEEPQNVFLKVVI
jgi:hypothetical protein